MKPADPQLTSGRAFVRSLNILLKFARLYGFDHARTTELLDVAFRELRSAIPEGTEAGLLLGATGNQLLLDGVPLEGSPAEKQFAQLLSSAGLASVQFLPAITLEELSLFSRAFPTGKAKPSELAEQLKTTLSGAKGVRINEICFVATDSRFRDANRVAQLAAATLGDDQDEFKQWLNDPQKLLEMIAAAQGVRSGNGSGGSGFGSGTGSGSGNYSGDGGSGAGTGASSSKSGGGFYYRDGSVESTTESKNDKPGTGADTNFFSGPVAEATAGFFGNANAGAPGTPGQQSVSVNAAPNARGRFVAEPTEDEILGILSALTS